MFSSPFDSLPTLPGERFLGHLHSLQSDRLGFMRRLSSAGPLARIRLLHRYVLFANAPQTAHQVLVEHASSFEKSPGIRLLLHDLGGEGLFTSEGELWKRQRRLISPLFHPSQLSTYVQSMNGEARRALGRWSDGAQVDLLHEMTRIAMGVVGSTLFGANTFNEADELGEALTTLLGWVDEHGAGVALTLQISALEIMERLRGQLPAQLEALRNRAEAKLNEPVWLGGRSSPKVQQALRTLDGRVLAMIRERRAHPSARKDLLTRLLLVRDSEAGSAASGMSDKQVRDEANTLFIAGHETTATALAWCFYLLARHPEIKARVQAEADAFGPDGPTAADPQALAYTTRVFKEALRLYPPVIILARRTLEPVQIGGVELPTRTVIFVSPYTLHLSPEIWPDPERFDPDRFLPEREAARHKSAWIPFGVGPRVCIGNYFALLEGPIVLATLMRRARFEIDPSRRIEPETFATLRPAGGVPATVRLV